MPVIAGLLAQPQADADGRVILLPSSYTGVRAVSVLQLVAFVTLGIVYCSDHASPLLDHVNSSGPCFVWTEETPTSECQTPNADRVL